MLKMKCFMFPRMGKICWIGLCKVWHMKAHSICHYFLPTPKKENPCLHMKAWKACCISFKWIFFAKTLVWQCWLVHAWNNAWHCQGNHYKSYENNKLYSISCDEMTSVDNHSWLSLQTYVINDWSKIPIMVSLKRWLKWANFGNFTKIIIQALFDC